MTVAPDAAQELPLDDERAAPEPKKHNRHVLVALNHLHKRRDTLNAQKKKIDDELEDILEPIHALG